jgi:hypothetical protein
VSKKPANSPQNLPKFAGKSAKDQTPFSIADSFTGSFNVVNDERVDQPANDPRTTRKC